MQKETGCSVCFICKHLATLNRNEIYYLSMEIILTNKKSELLIFEGYAYIKHRTLADKSLSWQCAQTRCNGRVRTKEDSVEIVKDHCHFPDPADIEKRKFRKTLKDRAAVSDVTTRPTIFAA